MIYFFVYNVFQTSCFFFLEKSSRPHMSKVANMFRQPSVLIETPDTPYFSVIRRAPNFSLNFSKLTNWKSSQNTRLWGATTIFGDVHTNYNNTLSKKCLLQPFSLNCTYVNKSEKGYIFWSKVRKSLLSTQTALFSKAANF